jgi:uncharacterized protein (DUF1501 family)
MTRQSRRSLLQLALRTTAVVGAAEMLPSFARASNVPLERAAVCIYLIGGNDSNSMIVPLDSTAYSAYSSVRGELAFPRPSLLQVNSSRQGAGFGFNPHLIELRDLYQQGSLAVLANTGPLNTPLTRAQALAKTGLPEGLLEHTQPGYAAYLPNGTMLPAWAPQTQPAERTDDPTQYFQLGGVSMLSPRRLNITGPAADNPRVLSIFKGAQLKTQFPQTTLGSQLHRIARLLKASPALGMDRPIFSATMSGFDTHDNQFEKQEALFEELSQAMAAFYAATVELGIASQVVTYTQTEFNRTLRPNRTRGTDHAWGGHELIMGGSVRGGDIYGTFPSLELGGPDDAGRDGIWIPTTANRHYDATVAHWFGAPDADRFNNLGFLG